MEKIECKICNNEFKDRLTLAQHVRRKHKLVLSIYYETYEPGGDHISRHIATCRSKWDNNKKLECKICSHIAKNSIGLGAHITSKHKEISVDEYYSKYYPDIIRKPNIDELKIECKICGHKCRNYKGLGTHLRYKHNMLPEEYYNKFLNGGINPNGLCLTCGNKTTFVTMETGYAKFCGTSCAMANEDVINLMIKNSNPLSIYSLKPYKTKFEDNVYYQSKLELQFIKLCEDNNIKIENGDIIPYIFNNEQHYYHIDFKIYQNNIPRLIEIKGTHRWYYEDIDSGLIEAKNIAAQEYSNINGYLPFVFILNNLKLPEV